jgi:hypothetical protein
VPNTDFKPSTQYRETLITRARGVDWMNSEALERAFATRLLVMTNGGPTEADALRASMRITTEAFDALIQGFAGEELLTINGGSISLGLEQRLTSQ